MGFLDSIMETRAREKPLGWLTKGIWLHAGCQSETVNIGIRKKLTTKTRRRPVRRHNSTTEANIPLHASPSPPPQSATERSRPFSVPHATSLCKVCARPHPPQANVACTDLTPPRSVHLLLPLRALGLVPASLPLSSAQDGCALGPLRDPAFGAVLDPPAALHQAHPAHYLGLRQEPGGPSSSGQGRQARDLRRGPCAAPHRPSQGLAFAAHR